MGALFFTVFFVIIAVTAYSLVSHIEKTQKEEEARREELRKQRGQHQPLHNDEVQRIIRRIRR
jgi:uncharacterized membrane protein